MNARWILPIVLVGITLTVTACAKDAPPPVKTVMLDDSFAPLREAFNASHGRVRLLFVVDSACAVCLRGMADINDDLLATTDDARLTTFVVHVPVIGGTAEHIAPAAALINNPNVTHYWNPSGAFGTELGAALNLQRNGKSVYAWDVWLAYGPEATWTQASPPAPDLLMHQLPKLRDSGYAFLDSEAFAAHARGLLSKLPAATTEDAPRDPVH